MMTTITTILLALPAVLALPSLNPRALSDFAPAAEGDLRSPCPALNALANHNILPHNGRDISRQMLIDAFNQISVDAGVSGGLYLGADRLGLLDDGILNLDRLNQHNGIEHDGSLSRADAADGDNFSFNQTFFDQYMANFEGLDVITLEDAAKARFAQIKANQARNPEMTYEFAQKFFSNGETALLMGALGDATIAEIPVEFVRIFFEEERFPFNEGFRPAANKLNLINLNVLLAKEVALSGELFDRALPQFPPGSLQKRSGHLALLDA